LRLAGDGLVLRAVAQPHQEFLGSVAGNGGGGSGGNDGVIAIGDVGHEDLAPVGGAGSGNYVLHVEDFVLKVLVEDTG